MREVEFDFQIAGEQVNRLDEVAEKLRQSSVGPFTDTIHEIGQGWQGESGSKFVSKAFILQDKMTGTSTLLGRTKKSLRQAAIKAEAMEIRAKEIAEVRTESR